MLASIWSLCDHNPWCQYDTLGEAGLKRPLQPPSPHLRQKADMQVLEHMRQLTTWQVFCQVYRGFHSRESNRQPLPWDLEIISAINTCAMPCKARHKGYSLHCINFVVMEYVERSSQSVVLRLPCGKGPNCIRLCNVMPNIHTNNLWWKTQLAT